MANMTLGVKILGDASSLLAAVDSAKSKLDGLYNSIKGRFTISDEMRASMGKLGPQLEQLGNKMSSFGKSYTTKVTAPIVGGAGLAVKSYKDWESAFTGVMKTVDETSTTTYKDLEKRIKQIAMETASSREEVAAVAEVAGQLGVSADDLADFTKTMVILGDTTDLSADEAATALARFMSVMEESQDNVDNLGATIVDLGNNFPTTEKEITRMATELAPYAHAVKLSSQDTLAFATAMSSVGIKAERGGSAMGRVLSLIDSQVKSNGGLLEAWAKTAGMTAEEFKKSWDTDKAGTFTAVINGLKKIQDEGGNVHEALYKLGDSVGGNVRIKSMMLALVGANDVLKDSIETANTAWDENTAAVNEAEKRYATFETKISQTKEHVKAAGDAIAEQLMPYVLKLLDGVQKVTDAFVKLSPEQQKFIIAIGGIAAAIGPVLIVLGKITSSVGFMMTAFGGAGSSILPLLGSLGKFAGIAGLVIAALVGMYQNSEAFREAVGNLVNTSLQSLKDIFEALKPAFDALMEALQPLLEALGDLLAPLIDILAAAIEFITPLLVGLVDALTWFLEAIPPAIDWLSQFVAALNNGLAVALDYINGKIEAAIEWFENFGNKMENVKESFSTAWETMKTTFELSITFIKEVLIGTWDELKNRTSETWQKIRESVTVPMEQAKETLSKAWQQTKDTISGQWESLKDTAGRVWDGIKDAITGPIEDAKDFVERQIDKIRNFFPIDIGKLFSNIRVPSFDLEWTETTAFGKKFSYPSGFDIDWYAKGGLFNRPSVIGVGEAGPEAVAPIDKLKSYVAEAVTNARSATMDYTAIDSLADAIATGFAMQSAGQQGGEYHFTVELGGARVAEKIFTLNKEGEMIMQGA